MIIENSSYPGAPRWQFGGHLQTIIPGVRRRVTGVHYTRERINTPDGDFLDLDWVRHKNKRLVILTHGLEGDTYRQYMLGSAKLFSQNGWDVLAWNCRSCSGEMNRAFRMYHHGDTEDISHVIQHALASAPYDTIALVGYSMGGNITMKYLGVQGENAPKAIKSAVVFSAPCDIEAGANVLDRWDNIIYKKRFLNDLIKKIRIKDQHFPGRLEVSRLKQLRRWCDFDRHFSTPISGYENLADFYKQASAKNYVAGIKVPTLLVSAQNDPILTPACFPMEVAKDHPFFHLELPKQGGHCGFQARGGGEFSWAEKRSLEFCMENLRN